MVYRPKLSKEEQKEWTSLQGKSKRNGIAVKRVSSRNSNVIFPANKKYGWPEVYAQLGTGRATMIMDGRIAVKKKR